MNDEYVLPIQKQCAIAFIDVLGIKNKIEFNSKWALDWMWMFYENIMNEIKNTSQIKVRIFSDNILICKEIDEKNPEVAIYKVISVIEKIEFEQFKIGALFLRGSFVVGDLHFSENFVYGPALLKAYELESKTAIYPRVIVDESVLKIIKSENTFISLDSDNIFFYDYLQAYISKNKDELFYKLSRLSGNILVNLKSKNITSSVIIKMNWLINYFNNTCKKNAIDMKIKK
jgi:hypothetical protein